MPKVAIFSQLSERFLDALLFAYFIFYSWKKKSVMFIYTVMVSGGNTYEWSYHIVTLIFITRTI